MGDCEEEELFQNGNNNARVIFSREPNNIYNLHTLKFLSMASRLRFCLSSWVYFELLIAFVKDYLRLNMASNPH